MCVSESRNARKHVEARRNEWIRVETGGNSWVREEARRKARKLHEKLRSWRKRKEASGKCVLTRAETREDVKWLVETCGGS